MLKIALFVYAFGYVLELTVTGWCIIVTYVAISNLFRMINYFLTFYCDPYLLDQILVFIYLVHTYVHMHIILYLYV